MVSPKPKRRRFKLLLATVSFLLALLVAEVALRASGRFPARDVHSISAADYDQIPGMWEPNQDFVSIEKPALPYHVSINSLGLRGPETTLEPENTRILCIGDSFTYGDYVGDDETLPAQIQRFLGDKFEVLNAGIRGTTVVDQLEFLPKMLRLRPDAVVLTYCEPNDLSDMLKSTPSHEQMAKDRALKSGVLRPVFGLIKDTCLFRLALVARRVLFLRPQNNEQYSEDAPEPLFKLPDYVSAVGTMRDQLRQQGISLYFVAFPSHGTWSGHPEMRNIEPVLEALAEINITGIDPTEAFTASGLSAQELYCLPHDGHPNVKAYEICGRVVAKALRANLGAP